MRNDRKMQIADSDLVTNLDIDANPEEEEQSPEPHEQRCHGCDDQLLHDVPGELGGGHLRMG